MWNFVGPGPYFPVTPATPQGGLSDDAVIPTQADKRLEVLDDDINIIKPESSTLASASYRLPFRLDRTIPRLPKGGENSRVPMIQEFVRTRNESGTQFEFSSAAAIKSSFEQGKLKPAQGNHVWTGRNQNGSPQAMRGGNFGYDDGSVRWRTSAELRPRLFLPRPFDSSVYPLYWW